MLGVIVHAKVKEDLREQFCSTFSQLAAEVRAHEPGNVIYAMGHNEVTDTYVVLEVYRDQAAIEAHRVGDHFRRMFPEIQTFLTEPLGLEYIMLDVGSALAVPQ